ncbi:peptide ABC transporter substrate-binding protein [Candidatus Sumerlaeota bacterium]|nr:peptide ABC transporter substrate-binding protein [Candidatus Sumerlaeota bacterium]
MAIFRLPAAVTLLATVALVACRGGDSARLLSERRKARTVVCNLGAEPTTLDPARATRLTDLRALGQCFEGLTRLTATGQPEPAAAQSWDISPDSRVYRFRLRPAQWSNGDPVRSSDFAFAWRRTLDPATRGRWAHLFFAIEGAQSYYRASSDQRPQTVVGIETPDDRTIVVRLVRPVPYFLSLASLESYYPVHQATVERLGEAAFRAPNLICNGPLRIVERLPRQRIVLEPNPLYRDRSHVALSRLVFVMVENEFTEWAAYRRGQVDITYGIHRNFLSVARTWPDFCTAPLVGTNYLVFNCARPPFDRVETRRAFALSLDRRLLCERILRGGEQPATAFVAPGIPWNDQPTSTLAPANAILPAVGPMDDQARDLRKSLPSLPVLIVLAHEASETARSLAIAIQMMWRQELGIEVELQSFPGRVLAQKKHDGEFTIASNNWVADYLDPTTFLDIFRRDSENNVTRWSDPRYDALLDRAAATSDTMLRSDCLRSAERLLLDQMPVCPIYFYAVTYLQRPYLEGLDRNPLGRIYFWRVGFAQDK